MSDTAMIVAGAIACLGLSGAGSAFGTGFAASAAVGAWKKCYAAGKPAPFLLLSFVGAPITMDRYKDLMRSAGYGIFSGFAIGVSALFQGRAAAAACDAQAETNQGFTNYLAALGIIETVAIFTMVFTLIAVGKIG